MDADNTSRPLGTPAAEFEIDSALVRALLADQHSDLARLPLLPVDSGWDNAMFRLGDELAVRLPRRAAAAALIVHEHVWLPRLADRLTLPVSAPFRVGRPACGYLWPWSVVEWLPGNAADECQPLSSEAGRWGAFLRSLHVAAPVDAPANPVRGVALSQRASVVEARLQQLASTNGLNLEPLRHIWSKALAAPMDASPTWLHGDLHPRNILVENGILAGVIDWGDITSGDPATDLASIWILFADAPSQQAALSAYGNPSVATLGRAKGWAVLFGVMLQATGLVDNARNARLGEIILRRVARSG